MHNILVPKGRLRRSNFWGYLFMLLIWYLSVAALMPFPDSSYGIVIRKIIGYIIYLIEIWCISCLFVQRLHDLNKPMEHLLFLLVPIYNMYILFCILFVKGDTDSNKYGDSPYFTNL